MTQSAADILQEFGLHPPSTAPGRYYTICPQCSHQRSREHQNAQCLGITIDDKGVQFGCNHCEWKGGGYYSNGHGKLNGDGAGKRHIVETYDYFSADGELAYQAVRYEPKDFRQRRPNGNGTWIWDMKGVERVLYCQAELIEAVANNNIIVICEGEKDVNSLWAIGVPATCNVGGAGKWRPEYNKHFRDADVVLIPDNDEPGHKHIADVGAALTGIAKRIRVLMLSEKDATAWLAAGGTREAFDRLVEQAPDWQPPPEAPADKSQDKAKAEADEQKLIDELARLDRLNYEQRRTQAARDLEIRRGALDDEVEARRNQQREQAGPAPLFGDWIVEPYENAVTTAELLAAVISRIERQVILSKEAVCSTALWTAFGWVHEVAAVHSPILLITAPERDSGKTTLAGLVRFLSCRAMMTAGISEAALFRGIELWKPTVVITEADTILKDNEPLRAVINSGWTRGTGVVRCIGEANEPHFFPTFCPKVIDMKGKKLPDTTLSRSIIIDMQRKRPGEHVEHFKQIDDAGLAQLRRMLLRWSIDNSEHLAQADPMLPAGFDNRLGDNWRLLFAIADLGGQDWSERARQSAQNQDASGRCLAHCDAIRGEHVDAQTAIALAKRMIVDGRMPTPEDAAQQLNERLAHDHDRDELGEPWELLQDISKVMIKK